MKNFFLKLQQCKIFKANFSELNFFKVRENKNLLSFIWCHYLKKLKSYQKKGLFELITIKKGKGY